MLFGKKASYMVICLQVLSILVRKSNACDLPKFRPNNPIQNKFLGYIEKSFTSFL
jgi:hypothetical protein